ncbi:hypothetical protein BmR1_04g07335 [Babesia microti strain RI]|uniref:Fcf2 pre-rRNA processing C-terminal domain-containing protein n=1 Tax=Babesia microti (strain RI) TaxID=1133968 RepID=A0A1N6LXY2_BABMR|nr:hypothetical protein BmR1_04g07335 [Babesia microti strain RI]SIO73736.1 hypothetical protein BmR1_04g07335 [Babesia microti strain RI]|eukprot:XP_012650066.2 hypothetical protein BmR1_04g07335 [Babesia microti strain RI]
MEDRDLLIASIHSEKFRKSFANKYCNEESTFLDDEFLHPFKGYQQHVDLVPENEVTLDFLKPKYNTDKDTNNDYSWHEMPDKEASEQDIREWTAIQLRSFAEKDRFYKSAHGKLQRLPKKFQVGVIGGSRKPKSFLSHLVRKKIGK